MSESSKGNTQMKDEDANRCKINMEEKDRENGKVWEHMTGISVRGERLEKKQYLKRWCLGVLKNGESSQKSY